MRKSDVIRFRTFLRDYGPITPAQKLSPEDWLKACNEGRHMTIYHGESDWCTPVEAALRHHGYVNTMLKAVCTKPPPTHLDRVIGLRDNEQAWALVTEQVTVTHQP